MITITNAYKYLLIHYQYCTMTVGWVVYILFSRTSHKSAANTKLSSQTMKCTYKKPINHALHRLIHISRTYLGTFEMNGMLHIRQHM